MPLLLTGLGKGYCCILLQQIRPEGKFLSSHIVLCAHTTRIANIFLWRDVIAGSSAPPFHRFKIYLAKINTKWQVLANKSVWLEDLNVISVSAKFQVQTLCCLPEISKCIGAELQCLLVKGWNSTDSKIQVRYLGYGHPFNYSSDE